MENLLNKFEDFLIKNLPQSQSFHPYFQEALALMLKAKGKRFRPLLLLSIVNLKKPLLISNAMHIALAVEFLHTYSLIHDDLPAMDNADLRRGFTTLHKKYDEATAVLVGDALNTHSFYLIANASLHNDIKIELIKCLSSDGGIDGMVLGQALDCYFENQTLSLEQLKFLHVHKTAKLIASSLKMGAIISQYDKKTQNKLYDFGLKLGLLFQIQDDIIDETLSTQEAGKTTQNDLYKNSFVTLLGLDGAKKSADDLVQECIDYLNTFDEDLKTSLEKLVLPYLNRHRK